MPDKGTVERTWSQLSFSYKEKGIITTWNKRAEEVLGHKAADVVGQVWTDLVVDQWREACLEALEKVRVPGEEVVLPMLTADGLHCSVRCVVRKFGRNSCFFFSCGHTPPAAIATLWPLEIRHVDTRGLGAFALRDLAAGELLLEEEPFYIRMPPQQLQGRPEWDAAWVAAFNGIRKSLVAPKGSSFEGMPEKPLLASTALVRDLLSFVLLPESLRNALMGFSFPPLDSDHALVQVARSVAELCQERLPECKDVDVRLLQLGILVTEMNIFPGGRIFWTMSRINHSCAPNCVFISGRWGLRTVRPIAAGEEIFISYLGEELLLPSPERQWLLWRSKCFICACRRCSSLEDPLRDRSCLACLPVPRQWRVVHQPAVWRRREPSTQGRAVALMNRGTEFKGQGVATSSKEGLWVLTEDSDPKKSGWVLVDGSKLGLGLLIEPIDPDFAEIWPGQLQRRLQRRALSRPGERRDVDWYVLDAPTELPQWRQEDGAPGAFARLRDGRFSCSGCGAELAGCVQEERVLSEVAQRVFAMALPEQRRANAAGVKGLALPAESFVLAALRLADDAGALFGRRHWIWHWGLLFAVDLEMSLNRYTYRKWDADWISGTASMLLEVWDWLSSLGLSQAPGYFLHSRLQRLSKEMDGVIPSEDCNKERFQRLQRKLQQCLEGCAPPVSLLPSRDFIPETLFIAH